MLQYGRTLELTEKDALEVEAAQNSSQQTNELTKDVHRLSIKTKRTLPKKMASQQMTNKHTKTCFKCGGQWPHPDRKCPAYQRQCRKCQGFNHFARCCKSRQAKRPSFHKKYEKKDYYKGAKVTVQNIENTVSDSSDDDDSELEYVYTLSEEEFENQHNDPVDINGSHENVNGVDLLENHNMKAANRL